MLGVQGDLGVAVGVDRPVTGLQLGQFRKLVATVAVRGGDAIADGRRGRQWSLSLPDRVLLVARYWRTNLTMRQIGSLFGVSRSAAHRVIDTLGPLLALAPVRKRRVDQVTIVDGTLVPTRDHRLAAPSKNYRVFDQPAGRHRRRHPPDRRHWRSTTREPQRLHCLPRLWHQPPTCRQAGDGRRRLPGQPWRSHALPQATRRQRILRDYRRAAHTLTATASGIAFSPQLTITG
jgi:hypothetical protein